jgi:hypothetical protein
MINRDRLNSMPLVTAGEATMGALDGIQRFPREAQVLASAALFVLMCERFGLDVQDMMSATSNLMNHASGRRPEFAAVAAYMAGEL